VKNIYIYAYLDPRKPGKYKYGEYSFSYEPFYIGKGYGNRMYNHLTKKQLESGVNPYKRYKIKKIIRLGYDFKNGLIIKIKQNLNDKQSIKYEKLIIKKIGRKDLKLGPLLNYTDGGEGCSGRILSDKTKNKISKSHMGIIPNKTTIKKFKQLAKNRTLKHRMKIALAQRKTTPKQDKQIFKMYSVQRMSKTNIAKKFKNLSRNNIIYILKRMYKAKNKNYPKNSLRRQFSSKQILNIRNKYKTGKYSMTDLSKKYNSNSGQICMIINYKTYKDV